jgi:uncharacterized protein (TIRG00374 family)
MSRGLRITLQLAVTTAFVAYLVWKVDIGRTVDFIAASNPVYLVLAAVVFTATLWPMAWRWQVLLASKGVHEPLRWLAKLYLIGYAASQVLPTGVGGDAVRIVEHARRRPKAKGEVAGAVLMERIVGSAGILLVVAVGIALAVGRYDDIGLLVWVEVACVVTIAFFCLLLFSRRANALLHAHVFPRGGAARLNRAIRAVWNALHGYRSQKRALGLALAVTVAVQFVRMITIWLCGEAVGLDESLLVYIILTPLLFLVMMIPITVNGLGVRESFFVFFLGRFGVDADAAFATGFLFYVVTVAASIPGGAILLWRSVRPALVRPRAG